MLKRSSFFPCRSLAIVVDSLLIIDDRFLPVLSPSRFVPNAIPDSIEDCWFAQETYPLH